MGGLAFPALNVPRLSPSQYVQLREQSMAALSAFFCDVTYPRPAPEKTDYGDVDIYVCRMKPALDIDAIYSALNATARVGYGHTHSFAVPLSTDSDYHAQIDVHVCSQGYLEWELFMSGYGDLVQILGVLNRHLGITMNDKGINVRVEELETSNRPLSMILLTHDPSEAMQFLGLDADKWKQGFHTEAEIFAWCSAGKYYRAPTKNMENADDRARLRKRPMFSRFIDEWVPEHTEIWQTDESSRQRVLQDALDQFEIQGQYDHLINHHKKEIFQRRLTEAVQQQVPAGKVGQRIIMRGIKRWVTWQDGVILIEPEAAPRDAENAPANPDWFAKITEEEDMANLMAWLQINHTILRDMEARFADRRKNAVQE